MNKRLFMPLIIITLLLFVCLNVEARSLAKHLNQYQAKYGWASSEDPEFCADFASDNNIFTRWDSKHDETNSWIAFDFGKTRQINTILIIWEAAYARVYAIDYSNDAEYWRETWKEHRGDGGMDLIQFTHYVKARYLRLRCSQKANDDWGYSVFEFQVWGEN